MASNGGAHDERDRPYHLDVAGRGRGRVPVRAGGHRTAQRLHGLVAAEHAFPPARRGADRLDGDGRELRADSRLPVQRRRAIPGQGAREESEHERATPRDSRWCATTASTVPSPGRRCRRAPTTSGSGSRTDSMAWPVASAVVSDRVSSRVTGQDAVVTPTLNPLVALYSAPPCHGDAIRVRFRPANGPPDAPWTRTNALPCVRGQSRNFLVAGMLANTTYEMVQVGGEDDARLAVASALHDGDAARDAEHSGLHHPPGARSGCRASARPHLSQPRETSRRQSGQPAGDRPERDASSGTTIRSRRA